MSDYPQNLKYTKDHEWIKIQGDEATVGITDYAAEQLGDVVFVELPDLEKEFNQGDAFGVVESVKSVSDLYLPVSGQILAVNDSLSENSGLVNEDPYGEGWIAKVKVADPAELKDLLSANDYETFLSEEA